MLSRFTQKRSAGYQESKDPGNVYYLLSKPWFLIVAAVLFFTALQVNARKFSNESPFSEPLEMKEQLHVVKRQQVQVDPFEDEVPNSQDSLEKSTMVLKLDPLDLQLNIAIEPLTN